MKQLIFVFAFLAFSCGGDADNSSIILGCTDPTSINYDANANTDDGSCIDEATYSLIGTWSGTVTDTEDNSQGQLTLVLNSNATGSIDVVWSEDDIFSDNFTWTSNDTQIITVSDTDNEGDEVLNYSFVDQNTLEISSTDDDDDSSTLTRQ